jgi:hypothetical protein
MIRKIKQLIRDNKIRQQKIIAQNDELIWASVFRDSIKGLKGIENLPLNIGRWAGSYPFFYVLNRILKEYQPKKILEFGLGESSKFISTYLQHHLLESEHIIIEQDSNWKLSFETNFVLSSRSNVYELPLIKKKYKEFEYNGYENIENTIATKFDVYIIDGPFGSPNYSRFDIVALADILSSEDEFILIMDDYNRNGEKETVEVLLSLLKSKNVNIYTAKYSGVKSLFVIATEKYKYVTSL